MLKNNFKKAFTLAELMVVLAIIWILSAAAMNIFSWAIAEARDSTRVNDLNTIKTSLESYYIKHKIYPQPAEQKNDNVWGYAKNKDAIATCPVYFTWWTINWDLTKNSCGWDIKIRQKKVDSITCNFDFKLNTSDWASISSWTTLWTFTLASWTFFQKKDWTNEDIDGDWIVDKVLDWVYELDDLNAVCYWYVAKTLKNCEDSDTWTNFDCTTVSSTFWVIWYDENGDSAVWKMYYYYKNTDWQMWSVSKKSQTYNSSNAKEIIIWWKWTLTEKSWERSVVSNKSKKLFSWYLQSNPTDPKYKASKYKDFWFGYYPYSVFRDNVWETNSTQKSTVWWTAYQIAATLEKQDKDWNYHPETLIIWNYKRPKNSDWKIKAWYPRSLFWNWKNVIISWQKEWEKAKYVARPNWKTNRWIPYPVEEIQ